MKLLEFTQVFLGVLGITYLGIVSYFYFSTEAPKSQALQIDQVHVEYSSASSVFVTWLTRPLPKSCFLSANGKTIALNNYTHQLYSNYVYKAELTELKNSQVVDYEIRCLYQGKEYKKQHKFLSHPGYTDGVKMLILGDWSTSGTGDWYNKYHTLVPKPNILSPLLAEKNYSSIWQLGDYAYDLFSNQGMRGDRFFKDIEQLASYYPYMPVVGNHEIPRIFRDFKYRFSNSLYYSMPMGKAMVVVLSSEFDYYHMKSAFPEQHSIFEHLKYKQLDWAEKTLSSIDRTKYPWVIVMFHKCLYCSLNVESSMIMEVCGKQASVMRSTFEKLLNKHKVDLVLSGHIHLYERILPVSNGVIVGNYKKQDNLFNNPGAPIYVVNGVAGNLENEKIVMSITKEPSHWSSTMFESLGYGILNVVNETHLHYEQYGFGETQWDDVSVPLLPTKKKLDSFTITKSKPN